MSALTLVLFLALALLSTGCGGQPEAPLEVVILAGQSNMAGRGGVSDGKWDGVVPRECSPNPSVLRLTAELRWEEAHEPLHADIDVNKTNGVGPGMAFANRVVAAGGGGRRRVGLVPCAVGGSAIGRWEKGAELYESTVRRAMAAAREVEGGRGKIEAVLWYQGESDTVNRTDAEAYKSNMEKMVADLRTDLRLPDLLFIQVALASGEGEFVGMVREAQKGMRIPNVVTVDATGLSLEEDHLHLTTSAQVQLGGMLAAAYLQHITLP